MADARLKTSPRARAWWRSTSTNLPGRTACAEHVRGQTGPYFGMVGHGTAGRHHKRHVAVLGQGGFTWSLQQGAGLTVPVRGTGLV
jgi:hypothetical protein